MLFLGFVKKTDTYHVEEHVKNVGCLNSQFVNLVKMWNKSHSKM